MKAPAHPVTARPIGREGGSLERPAAAPFQAPYAEHSKAPATWEAYRRDWAQWEAWLAPFGVRPDDATPEHVAAWCVDLADQWKASTVGRKVASISAMYRFVGRRSPARSDLVRTTLAGIRRAKGTARRQAAPLTADLLRQIVADLDRDRPTDCRDAAVLLVGFALAGRRSELVALDVADVVYVNGGMKVRTPTARPIRRRSGRPWVCRPARRRSRARSDGCAAGWPCPASGQGRSFGWSTTAGTPAAAASPHSRSG